MRTEDLEPFKRPYPADDGGDDPTRDGFAKACGVRLRAVDLLSIEIAADRDEHLGGIAWWAGADPGDRRRILIADALLQATRSIKINLIEARLHQLEGRSAADQVSEFNANAVRLVDGEPDVKMPARTTGLDDLPMHMVELHHGGFFRAIGSAVDCLGAACVGVAALPTNLLRSDLTKARQAATKAAGIRPLAQELTANGPSARTHATWARGCPRAHVLATVSSARDIP